MATKLFAARLLFFYDVEGESTKYKLCEERILHLKARSGKDALNKFNREGQKAEFDYTNVEDEPVTFNFLGIIQMMCIEGFCEENEVWYDLYERLDPIARKDKLIPPIEKLEAIRLGD